MIVCLYNRLHLKHILRALSLCTAVLILSAGGLRAADDLTEANKLYKDAAASFNRLYSNDSYRNYKSNWLKTISKFENIYRRYPYTIRAAQSLYNIGKLYRSLYRWNSQGDFIRKSNETFRLLSDRYKSSYLADDALYEIALNYEEVLGDKRQADIYFTRMLEAYPESEYGEDVKRRLNLTEADGSVQYKTEVPPPPPENTEQKTDNGNAPVGNTVDETLVNTIEDTSTGKKAGRAAESTGRSYVRRIDRWTTTDWTRIVIQLSSPSPYKYNTLSGKDGNRFYVDIQNAVLPNTLQNRIVANDGIIRQLRPAQFDKDTVRVVLDLQNYSDIKIFTFEFADNYKIVLDVISKTPTGQQPVPPPANIADKKNTEPKTPPPAAIPGDSALSLQKIFGLRVERIIIDPGHGGRDPGAVNGKYREKDITLRLAKELKQVLEQNLESTEILLTRDRDIFVELEARTAFANKNKGDLFISLHVNSHKNPSAKGVETYFLNLTKDPDALRLAALENSASLKNVSDLQSILNDLMVNNKLRESHAFAEEVNNTMHRALKEREQISLPNRGIKQAPFVVLLGANMPSILVEIGFISNTDEAVHMQKDHYINTLAQGLYKGIDSYIRKYTAVAQR